MEKRKRRDGNLEKVAKNAPRSLHNETTRCRGGRGSSAHVLIQHALRTSLGENVWRVQMSIPGMTKRGPETGPA